MKTVRDLTRHELEYVVATAIYRLWVNEDAFDLEQEVDSEDFLDDMSAVLKEVGLAPDAEQDGENANDCLTTTRETAARV